MWFDSDFSLSKHVHNVFKSGFMQLCDLRHIRWFLTHDASKFVANAPVSNRLDKWNSLLHYCWEMTCSLDAMDSETLQQKTTHKGRENSNLQDLQRQEGGGECVSNISEQSQGTTGHHGAKAKGCQRYCFNMCGVAQYAEDTPNWCGQGILPRK